MGIFDRITDRVLAGPVQRVLAQKTGAQYPGWALATAEAQKFNIPRMELPEAQAELYMRLSWVAIAVGNVARVAASVPLEVMQEVGEDEEEIINHPFELLLKRPNPRRSRFEFLEASFLWRQLTGNAYWWLNKANESAAPSEMWILPSHRMEPVPDGNMYLKGYLYDPGDGQKIPLEPWEVVHFRTFNPFNPFVGLSPIEALATVAVGDLKMQEFNTTFYGEDNAKIPGVLSFADPINDSDWIRLLEDIKEQGKKRNMLTLRNTGAGGVNWVAMALSQKDMEYLNARRFNQQEIYDLFAPGLNQWLSPDTNNANSKSGRDAFFELSIFPLHTAIAETTTNNIMPLYGENQTAQFEDVRPKDRELVLKEQAAFGRVHTIDEIRNEFYNAKGIGDERGALLPAEIKVATGGGGDVPAQLAEFAGKPPAPEPNPQDQVDETSKRKERDRFRRFAGKRIGEGKPEKIAAFEFEHLDATEQETIKAEFVPQDDGYNVLVNRLGEVIDVLRNNHAETTEANE